MSIIVWNKHYLWTTSLSLERTLLTPKNLLRIVNSQYDPLGPAAPITVRLRIAFRNMFRSIPNLEWDTPLPKEHQHCWLDLVQLVVNWQGITFDRSLKPSNSKAPCQLICFLTGQMMLLWQRYILDGNWLTSYLCVSAMCKTMCDCIQKNFNTMIRAKWCCPCFKTSSLLCH